MTSAGPPIHSTTGAEVRIDGLRKSYGAVKAVDGVTLTVAAGEFVALLGPSGSGKTTILNTIAGFETPDAGIVEIAGRDVTSLSPSRREIGMVFQRYALFPHMTVAENIAFPLKMRRLPRAEVAGKVADALGLVRLQGYGDRRIGQLSGGQQQRVALARALVYRPPLLLMDEPLGALDKNLREEMQVEIKRIQQELGTTVIFVTHDQAEALGMADRVAVLDSGKLLQYAKPYEVYHRPVDAFVASFLGETNFIDGILRRDATGGTFTATGTDLALEIADDQIGPSCQDGMAARLAIRPESLSRADAVPALSGVVQDTTFVGNILRCRVLLSEGLVFVASFPGDDQDPPEVGQTVGLKIATGRVRVFPK